MTPSLTPEVLFCAAHDHIPHCAHQCITKNEMQIRKYILNTKLFVLSLVHHILNLVTQDGICWYTPSSAVEGSYSVSLPSISFGQPSKQCCPHAPCDSSSLPVTLTTAVQGSGPLPAPSQPETKLSSPGFFFTAAKQMVAASFAKSPLQHRFSPSGWCEWQGGCQC